jgi:hypothetical protein
MSAALDSQPIEPQGFTNPDPITAKLITYHEQHAADAAPLKEAFIAALRDCGGIVRRACEAVRIDSKTAYIWRSIDPQFREAWDYALEDANDVVEDSLYRQATSDKCFLATIAWLKARRPMYRDKVQIDVSAIQREIEQRVDELAAIDSSLATSNPLPPSKNTLAELLTSGQLQLGPSASSDTDG